MATTVISFVNGLVLLGAFQNCEKRTLASSCASVRPHGTTRLHRTDFHEIWNVSIFRKCAVKIQVPLKSDKNKGTLHEDQYTFFITSRSNLLKIKTFQTNVVEKMKVQTSCSMPFHENRNVYEIMRKNVVETDATDKNRAHAHCMLDT